MQRDEMVKLLRQLSRLRLQLEMIEDALAQLTECEREIIDKMYIHPAAGASDKICEKFDIEVAAVYRRRNKALEKLRSFM